MKLKDILNEAPKKVNNYPDEILNLVDNITTHLKYKKYSVKVNTMYGRYVIELPTTGFTAIEMKRLASLLGNKMSVEYSPYNSFSGMIIRTEISV